MKVMISGSSGLIGSALIKSLELDDCEIVRLPRSYDVPIDFSGVDGVIHLAGAGIAEQRWTADRKREICESRVLGTRKLVDRIMESPAKPGVFICASAIGYYGDCAEEEVDETSAVGTGFLSSVCAEWEAAAKSAALAGVRTVCIRTGIVLSRKGGALKQMLTPFRLGGGGVLGRGNQYMSWISLADEVRAIRFLLEDDSIEGGVNLVAPGAVTNREFTKALGRVLKRPTILPMPAPAARLIFGEMAQELLLSGACVRPKKLIESGFEFCHTDLQSALEEILR